jgi:hypothetical protein
MSHISKQTQTAKAKPNRKPIMKKQTISAIISAFFAAMITDKRTDGTDFIRLDNDAPEWMSDAIQKAHGGMMPDDMRYKMIRECLGNMLDRIADDAEDFDNLDTGEIADGLVDIYNMARLEWLASSLYRAEYCDDAQADGLVAEDATIFDRIGMGQYQEYSEILWSLQTSILEVFEDEENESEDGE